MTTKLLSLSFLLTFTVSAFAQTAEKTLSKSFNTEGKTRISFELPGNVDLKIWDQPTIKVEVRIALPNGSASMLNELANVGRYNMSSTPGEQDLIISAPNMLRSVKVKGETLLEVMDYVVYIPEGLEVLIVRPGAVLATAK